MPRFDRYLLSRLTVLFGFFALVLVSISWLNQAVKLFEQLIGDGQSALVFLEFSALALPDIIRLVLPLAAFAGTVQVMTRISNDSELLIMQAIGCSPWRLARPVLVYALAVAGLGMVLTNWLVPASQAQLVERQAEISHDISARFLSEGQFLHPAPGITFYIRDITATGELGDIFLSDARRADRRTTYTARRALLVDHATGPKLVMFDGMAQSLDLRSRQMSTARFVDFTYDIGALMAARLPRPERLRLQSTRALLDPTPALLQATASTRAEALQEAHDRFANPLLAVAGAMIGCGALLLGGFSRFGAGRQMGIAVLLLIAVHLLDNSSADLARRDAALWPILYAPPLAGLGAGAAMIALSGRRRRVGRGAMA